MPDKEPRLPDAVPDLLVERLALGDLDPEGAADVRARLQATNSAALDEVAASNQAILDAHPAAAVLAEARRRMEHAASARARSTGRHRWVWLTGAFGAAAAAVVIFAGERHAIDPSRVDRPGAGAAQDDVIRKRGLRPHLIVYKKTPDGPARLVPGGHARPGDLLQVAYVSAGRRYGIVASQDAVGTITFHLPTSGTEAVPLTDGGEVPAANAFELDASPGYERFVFVTSDRPFPASAVVGLLRAQRDPAQRDRARLPPALSMMDLTVIKEVR